MRRLLTALLAALLALPPAAAFADDDVTVERTESLTATVVPGSAAPGTTVEVVGSGWPAFTQVQAVLCGDLAIGGSSTCDQSGAVLASATENGMIELDLLVGRPPAPCPCVVRVASYQGSTVAVDAPFTVIGHPVGTPPEPVVPAPRLEVTEVRLEGSGGPAALFGAAPERRVVLTLQNTGTAPAVNPQVRLGVGKSASTEPTSTTTTDLTIEPLQSVEVSVTVGLPIAAFGDYRVVAQVGDDPATAASTTWTAYPWGLIALNVLGLVLLVWGIRRRMTARRRADAAAQAARHRATAEGYALPDVVYVEALGGFLVSPRAASRSRVLRKVDGRLEARDLAALLAGGTRLPDAPSDDTGAAVVDLAAVERWLARRGGRGRSLIDELLDPPPAQVRDGARVSADAVVDIEAADRWLERRDRQKGSA